MTDLVHFTKIIFQTLFLAQFIEKQYFCTGFQNLCDYEKNYLHDFAYDSEQRMDNEYGIVFITYSRCRIPAFYNS